MLPRKFQSRYRRHLVHFKPFFNSSLRDDLLINFLVSLFTSYKNSNPSHSISEECERNKYRRYSQSHSTTKNLSRPLSVFSALLSASSSLPNKTEKKTKKSASSSLSLLRIILKHILGKRQTPREREREKSLQRHTATQRTEALPARLFCCERKKEREARPFCGAAVLRFLFTSAVLPFYRERRYIETHMRASFVQSFHVADDGARKMETRRTRASRNAKNERCFDEASEET